MKPRGGPSPRQASGSRGRAAGFTLVELLVVLAILALVLAVIPRVLPGSTATAELKGAARTLASAVRATRSEAVRRGRDAVFILDLANREYSTAGGGRRGRLPESLTYRLFTAESERMSETQGGIRFFPDGSSTGGRITVALADRKYLIAVDWLTGRVTVGE